MSTLVPPERLAAFLTTSQAQLEAELTEEMVEAFGERGARHAGGLLPPLGRGPLDARLHHRLAARRRDVGGPAARHARAALLRLRLGPVGLRLHGGRGADRPRRRRRRAGHLRKISTCTAPVSAMGKTPARCDSCVCKQFPCQARETDNMNSTARQHARSRRHLVRGPGPLDRRLLREAPRHRDGPRQVRASSRARSRSASDVSAARAYGTVQVSSINTNEPGPRRAPPLGRLLRRRGRTRSSASSRPRSARSTRTPSRSRATSR